MKQLPDFLKLSSEQTEANNRAQDELRRKFNSRLKLSPIEEERARAGILEPQLKETYEALKKSVSLARHVAAHGISTISSTDIEKTQTELYETSRQLADALAAQGRFLEAAQTTKNKSERERFKQIFNAVWRDDAEDCPCEQETKIIGQARIKLPKHRIVKEIYSLKHTQAMNLLECVRCGFLNVRPLTDELQKIEQAKQSENKVSDLELFKQ